MSKKQTRNVSKSNLSRSRGNARGRRSQERLAAQQRDARRKRFTLAGIILVLVLIVGVGGWLIYRNNAAANMPVATSIATSDIQCNSGEMSSYHVHTHLSIYISGKAVTVPAQIGINGTTCLYWLHTHATNGIIHVEAPSQYPFKLGNFLDIWGTKFANLGYPPLLDQNTGWQVYVNGKAYHGDYRNIPLLGHTLITMAYQSPGVKPDTSYSWGSL
ncbi:MAG TPA: hypothetical protein VFN23_06670 [Ktedonobacteraceae bacterium]|nr:hypothetical protein [Ktedonobacteraceae bacterium]